MLVDFSRQLMVALRLWRRQQRASWLKKGVPFPDWVFASVTSPALDESNVRKALNRVLDAADLHRRGPHQMRHSFASLLLQEGVPITYVTAQLGAQGSVDHVAGLQPLVARRVEGPPGRRADDTAPDVTQAIRQR